MSLIWNVSSFCKFQQILNSYLYLFKPIEIQGYAKFLGMDLENDKEFLFIAEEGLKAPVHEPWQTYFNENDEIFYVNSVTQQKMYDHPLDEEYRQKFLKLKAQKEGQPYIPPNQNNPQQNQFEMPSMNQPISMGDQPQRQMPIGPIGSNKT